MHDKLYVSTTSASKNSKQCTFFAQKYCKQLVSNFDQKTLTPREENMAKLILAFFTFLHLLRLALSQGTLPSLNIDRDFISVSGYSGGAFFAPQFHTAFSANISGSASWSGFPNLCMVKCFFLKLSFYMFLNLFSDRPRLPDRSSKLWCHTSCGNYSAAGRQWTNWSCL